MISASCGSGQHADIRINMHCRAENKLDNLDCPLHSTRCTQDEFRGAHAFPCSGGKQCRSMQCHIDINWDFYKQGCILIVDWSNEI